jgi:hypothetical protein
MISLDHLCSCTLTDTKGKLITSIHNIMCAIESVWEIFYVLEATCVYFSSACSLLLVDCHGDLLDTLEARSSTARFTARV